MNFNKQKIFEIILTALISAGIAFLQSLATANFGLPVETDTPVVAGIIGAGIRAYRV